LIFGLDIKSLTPPEAGKDDFLMDLYTPIYTNRLILREFEPDDWQDAYEYLSDPDVLQFMEYYPCGEEQAKIYVQTILALQKEQPRRHIKFAVLLKNTGRVIGECGLIIADNDDSAGLCYRLNRTFWNKGYGTEAAAAVIKFGFDRLRLHRISALCDTRNTASSRVAEKTGMKKEGCMREHKWVKDGWIDSSIYSILEHECQAEETAGIKSAV
jgi:ribosomal-protein-alanine N-acetyltransferase